MPTFGKREHLCLSRDIDHLFAVSRQSAAAYPVRAVWCRVPRKADTPVVQVLLSVAKRRLRHAVDRNRAKRQLREAYRLQKQGLWDPMQGQSETMLHVAFVWLSDKPMRTERVMHSMAVLLRQIVKAEQSAPPAL